MCGMMVEHVRMCAPHISAASQAMPSLPSSQAILASARHGLPGLRQSRPGKDPLVKHRSLVWQVCLACADLLGLLGESNFAKPGVQE